MQFRRRKLLLMEADAGSTPQMTAHPSPSPPPSDHRQINASSPSRLRGSMSMAPVKPTTPPFDSSMALTVLVLLAALFFMGFFSVYIRRFADDSSVDPSRRRGRRRRRSSSSSVASSRPQTAKGGSGLDPSAVQSLPLFSYGGAAEDPIDCPVCLAEFEPKEAVKAIPSCRHVFHPRCIDTWLSLHVSCPLCRTTRLFPAKDGGGGFLGVGLEEVCLDASGLGGGSSAPSDDTWTEGMIPPPSGVRRSRSCLSMGERVPSLQRTTSF